MTPDDLKSKEKDTFNFRQFQLHQGHAAMKAGTDSDLLGALAPGGCRILDIGTGTGVLSLMLAQRFPEARLTAVEIDADAVIDARRNFAESPFADRITLHHLDFRSFLLQSEGAMFDCIVCNPPYFDRSLECPDLGRTRARHTSSLPFPLLVEGAWRLLEEGGTFSVCIPPEVRDDFLALCRMTSFAIQRLVCIHTVPHKAPKRFVVSCRKPPSGVSPNEVPTETVEVCMRNPDNSRSDWYYNLMKDFLICDNLS